MLSAIRRDLRCFIKALKPDYVFSETGLHDFLCKFIQSKIEAGNARIAISLPPRHGKSTIISEYLPAFFFGNRPKAQMMTVSYGANLATTFGANTRRMMNTAVYAKIFPQSVPLGIGTSGTDWSTVSGGSYKGVGLGGSITGFGADLLDIDDIVKNRATAHSPAFQKLIRESFGGTLFTRVLPGGSVIILATRWSSNDLIGIVTRELGWEYLNIPAIATDSDPIGRKQGEALFPEFYNLDRLDEIRRSLNEYDWECLYQGNPPDSEIPTIQLLPDGLYNPGIGVYYNSVLCLYQGNNLVSTYKASSVSEVLNIISKSPTVHTIVTNDRTFQHPGLGITQSVTVAQPVPDYLPDISDIRFPDRNPSPEVLANVRYYVLNCKSSQTATIKTGLIDFRDSREIPGLGVFKREL